MPMNVSPLVPIGGIGFSLNDTMPNSDIVTAYLNETSGQAIVEDRFADGRFEPSKAGDSQNETILSAGSRRNGSQLIRFTRRVFSDDDCDVDLSDDDFFRSNRSGTAHGEWKSRLSRGESMAISGSYIFS